MLTEFERKRLQFFIKAASKGEWIQLSPGDVKALSIVEDLHKKAEEILKHTKTIYDTQAELKQCRILVDKPEYI